MAVIPGARLGPYELIAPLGSGGMGDVYRARDTRLGRDVALKVPASDRLVDPAARARFERETTIVARLTHPRICTLLDAGVEGDQPYFVMELLRGETLATRLDRAGGTGLPVAEALDIAAGICDALAFAHRHGVVHRDVKPANIMLTPDGVKLLDFGVARLRQADGAADARAGTATLSITGTPAYMAPEQIDGRADARADLFSLGAVLYEMLAGRRAFPGESSSDILGAVVRCAPEPLAEARPGLPAAASRIVHRCLRKDVDERWQSAADLGEAIRWAQDPAVSSSDTPAWRRRLPGRAWWVGVVLTALAVGVAAFITGRGSPTAPAGEFYVDDLALPDGERFLTGQSGWSRDGRRVALITETLGKRVPGTRLWLLEIGASRGWVLVDEAESVRYPSWSPDGQSLAYFRGRALVRLTPPSREPVVLTEAPEGRGTAWLDDDTILYAPEPQGDLWQVAAAGGTPRLLVGRQPGDLGVKFPVALAGNRFLFWAQRSTQETSEIRLASTQDPAGARTVVRSATTGAYADGYLFFVQDGRVLAQRVDPQTGTVSGPTEPVPFEAGMGGQIGTPYVTTGGRLVGIHSVHREVSELTWVDRTGGTLGTFGAVATYRTMALSPDGDRLLAERAAPGVDRASIWLIDVQSGAERQLVTEVGAMYPVWHPAQDRIAFRTSRGPGGSGAIHEYVLDTRDRRTAIETPTLASARPAAWLDDGLLWWSGDVTGRFNGIFLRHGDEQDRPYLTLRTGMEVDKVVVRPGGTGLAYMSNESGMFEIYADTFPRPRRAPWRITRGGGSLPKWSRDGRQLFYVSDGALHVIAMNGTNGGPSGTARRLWPFEGRDYDIHPDGRLLIQRQRRPETQYLRVFRNWANRPPTASNDDD